METVSFLKRMSASLDEMRTANELVDVVLVFGELRLACHKVILASSSYYFRRMFSGGLRESQSDEVAIKGIDAKTGKLLVKYLYSGKIDITEENAQNLLFASNMLLLDDLKAASEEFLCEHIQPSNCMSLLNLSHLYEMKDLVKRAQQFITDKWAEISDESMIELKEYDFTEILTAHDSHEDNFIRLQRWVKSDAERNERFFDLLQHVDLSRCSECFIRDAVMDEELLHNTKGMKLIQTALKLIQKALKGEIRLRHTVKNISQLYDGAVSRSSTVRIRNMTCYMEVIKQDNCMLLWCASLILLNPRNGHAEGIVGCV